MLPRTGKICGEAQYSLGPSKIAGGGATTPSAYALSGSVGQPNASSALAGGAYSLSGGFWPSLLQTPGASLEGANAQIEEVA